MPHQARRFPWKILGESCGWLVVTLAGDDSGYSRHLPAVQAHDHGLLAGGRASDEGSHDCDASDEDDARDQPPEFGIQGRAYGALVLGAGAVGFRLTPLAAGFGLRPLAAGFTLPLTAGGAALGALELGAALA